VTNGPDPLRGIEALGDLAGSFDTVKQNLVSRGWSEAGAEQAAISGVTASIQAAVALGMVPRRPPH
jgi:hypothetical protein